MKRRVDFTQAKGAFILAAFLLFIGVSIVRARFDVFRYGFWRPATFAKTVGTVQEITHIPGSARGMDRTEHRIAYYVGGKRYKCSSRNSCGTIFGSGDDLDVALGEYPYAGQHVSVFYDVQRPCVCFLNVSPNSVGWVVFGLGVTLGVLGIYFLFYGFQELLLCLQRLTQ